MIALSATVRWTVATAGQAIPTQKGRYFQHKYSPLAQSVERRTVNPCVVGSSPTGGAKKIDMNFHVDFFMPVGLRKAALSNSLVDCCNQLGFPPKFSPNYPTPHKKFKNQADFTKIGKKLLDFLFRV